MSSMVKIHATVRQLDALADGLEAAVSAPRARQLRMTVRQLERAIGAGVMPKGSKSQLAAVFSPRGIDRFLDGAASGAFRDDPGRGELSWSALATLRDCLKILGGAAGFTGLVLPRVYRERLDLKPPVPAPQRAALYRKLADMAAAGPLRGDGTMLSFEDRTRLLAMVAVVLDTGARSTELSGMRLDDLGEGEETLTVRRSPQNATHLPPVVDEAWLRDGTRVAVRHWLAVRDELVAPLEGAKTALWVSLRAHHNAPIGMPLRPRGVQRAYARGVAALNTLMAGEHGWEPLPTTLEQLRRSVDLDEAAA